MPGLLDAMGVRIEEIRDRIKVREEVLNGWEVRAARYLSPGQYEYLDDWRPLNVGDIWARQGQTAFMRRQITIPADWAGLCAGLDLITGGEGLLLVDGKPWHGVDDYRGRTWPAPEPPPSWTWLGYILLNPEAKGGESYRCQVEIKTGGYWEYLATDPSKPYLLSSARLVGIDRQVEQAYYDFKVAHDSAAAYRDAGLREAVLAAMKEALHPVDFRHKNSAAFASQLSEARQVLREKLAAIRSDHQGRIFFSGHSHIDVAWLWPLKETLRKVGRTYSTVAALMDEYPHYHFNCSQVPLFLFLKENFPSVYQRIKARIDEGRFEPVGGTWVEHDCNILSGESLVRQCLYGQRFFREEFGRPARVGWLPDAFGFSWALPQIYKKSGLEYFTSAKIAWNERNRFPYNTFWWQGVDGTRILTHLIHNTVAMYNSMVKPPEILKQWEDFNSKLVYPELLSPYGWGDGGGGPIREMLEYLPRLAEMPGLPKAVTGRIHDFFDRMAGEAKNLPVWNGEFYFERHRGTYTTQARSKRYNRVSELLYREAEMYGMLSALLGGEYPKANLTKGWQTILLNQFHDVVPGSSIAEVYRESHDQYRDVIATGEKARSSALGVLVKGADTTGEGTPVVVFNSLSWQRTDLAELDLGGRTGSFRAIGPNGDESPCQMRDGWATFVARDVPSCGFAVYRILEAAKSEESPFTVDDGRIATPYYDLTLSSDGSLTRIYDRAHQREVLPEGARANVLQVFEDKPAGLDAWDIDLEYQDKMWEFTADSPARVIESGPVRLVLQQTLKYGSSSIEQRIILYAHTPRIDFTNTVDWQERKTLLKVAFPVEVHSARATYEIAFGTIERPTHWNTSWDQVRFEVSGHRWADLSEGGYGVSLLNDCKYGWDVKENVVRLTLLRSPEFPDPEADRGEHQFTCSLLPHAGDWRSGTVQAGYELNVPLSPVTTDAHAGTMGKKHSFIFVDNPNVIVDTVKQAEDGGEMIVRAYEAHGGRGPVRLTFDRPIAAAVECNLLEEKEAAVDFSGSEIRFTIKPYQIRTIKVGLTR